MSKYKPLAKFLSKQPTEIWEASFSDIEKILGFALPQSAYKYQAWWANQIGEGHSQKAGWFDAGWRSTNVDLVQQTVVFERISEGHGVNIGEVDNEDAISWARLREITGIDDRAALERAAREALAQREAGRKLIALGGTMPDASAPARERSTY